jgi:hypothetical protein
MCDTYIGGIGYICYDCQSEFKEYLNFIGKDNLSESDIKICLKEFIDSDKDKYSKGNEITVDDFFNKNTK